MNDVRPGMVLLYKPVYESYDYEIYNSTFLIIEQAKFELFSQKLLLSYMCKAW